MRTVTASPSDFAFRLTHCPRCWWMASRGLRVPGPNLPAVFNHIDKGMKAAVQIEQLRALGIPARAELSCGHLMSEPIPYPALGIQLVVKGKLDKAFELDDGTFGIVDFKTSSPAPASLTKYFDQLHGYAHCIENPAIGGGLEVTLLGLVVFDAYSGRFAIGEKKDGVLPCAQKGVLRYLPCEIGRTRFVKTLDAVASLAAQETLPDPGSGCDVCAHCFDVSRMSADVARRSA